MKLNKWRNTFLTGTEYVKDAAESGIPVTGTGKATVSKLRKIIKSNGKRTICDIVKAVCIF